MLPKIKIAFLNGQLGSVPTSQDGLLLLVTGGAVVSSTFALSTPYLIYRPDGLEDLGVTAENNASMYKMVKDFYAEAEEGTPVYVMAVAPTEKMTKLCDKDSGPLKTMLQKLRGQIRGIIVARNPGEESSSNSNGLDEDVFTAMPAAQALAEWTVNELHAPIFIALEGRAYKDASSLKDLSSEDNDRVCIVIGDTVSGSKGAAMGTFAGRVAMTPVQRNIGRVRDGQLAPLQMYLRGKPIEEVMDDVATIYDKGYISPRVHVGKSGFYFTDDRMACEPTNDYAHLTNRRVIDKAYRIAYDTLLDYLNDEILVNTDGTMQAGIVKSWQASVEAAIDSQMTAQGELSADNGAASGGCRCVIDVTQNVLATNTVKVVLKVRPYGYARFIDVKLGFLVESA